MRLEKYELAVSMFRNAIKSNNALKSKILDDIDNGNLANTALLELEQRIEPITKYAKMIDFIDGIAYSRSLSLENRIYLLNEARVADGDNLNEETYQNRKRWLNAAVMDLEAIKANRVPLTAQSLTKALVMREVTIEEAISKLKGKLVEIDYSIDEEIRFDFVNRQADNLSTLTKNLLGDTSIWKWYLNPADKEMAELISASGYSTGEIIELCKLLETLEKEVADMKNKLPKDAASIRVALKEGSISNEAALLLAEDICRSIDESVINALAPSKFLSSESEEDIDPDDRENIDRFYNRHPHRITTEMVWNNFHDDALIGDYTKIVNRTQFSFNEAMLLRQLIDELKEKIALARGLSIKHSPKERMGKSAIEIKSALIRKEYTKEDALREVLATIMDIDAEFMDAYEKGYHGGYNSVECLWGIVQRERGQWPKGNFDDACDEDHYDQMLSEIKRMHYTIEEIIELKELEEELKKQLNDNQKSQSGETTKPAILNLENEHKSEIGILNNTSQKIAQIQFGLTAGHLMDNSDGTYTILTSLPKYLKALQKARLNMKFTMFSGKLVKSNGELYTLQTIKREIQNV